MRWMTPSCSMSRASQPISSANRTVSQLTLGALSEDVGARGVYLLRLRRAGRELPFTSATCCRTRLMF